MSPEEINEAELNALATALTALKPAPAALDRNRLFYEAGRSAMTRSHRRWRGLCAGLTGAVMALGGVMLWSPVPEPPERVVYVRVPVEKKETPAARPVAKPAPAPSSYERTVMADGDGASAPASPLTCLHLEQVVLRWGADALPVSASSGGTESSGSSTHMFDLSPAELERVSAGHF